MKIYRHKYRHKSYRLKTTFSQCPLRTHSLCQHLVNLSMQKHKARQGQFRTSWVKFSSLTQDLRLQNATLNLIMTILKAVDKCLLCSSSSAFVKFSARRTSVILFLQLVYRTYCKNLKMSYCKKGSNFRRLKSEKRITNSSRDSFTQNLQIKFRLKDKSSKKRTHNLLKLSKSNSCISKIWLRK